MNILSKKDGFHSGPRRAFIGVAPVAQMKIFLFLLMAASAAAFSAESFPDPAALPVRSELPDVLMMQDGERVASAVRWKSGRIPELKALFQNYEYGFLPPPCVGEAQVEREDKAALGGKATLREITLTLARPEGARIHLLLITPNQRPRPCAVFLGLNFNGNQALVADPAVRIPEGIKPKNGQTPEQTRGSEVDTWAVDQVD